MTKATKPVSRIPDRYVPTLGTYCPTVPSTGTASESKSVVSMEASQAPRAVVGTRKSSVVTSASPIVAPTLPRTALMVAP
jgi:hypothetical protein